ncbi:malonic semialdehyde reductase [Tahibacter sp. UC22_41]|uniref:malonic semialdehyde reductase n=1 Tax=Tahibacter sp. UC22_41 TaxID=3350178 RepID=UPI002B70D348|nr:malonic semialdehyde reductase [Tahibacter sp.]
MSHSPIDAAAIDQLFNDARTFRGSSKAWLDKPVTDAQLAQLYDLAKLAPTSANCSPARIVFIRSPEAKETLRRALDEGNVAQTMAAPVTALIGSDYAFYEHMDYLFPNTGARSWFEGKPEVIHNTAFRNASLQGGYLILAARALGLDCGPMSGFNNALADELFFAGTQVKSNFLVNIGYGNPEVLKPRNPRFTFDQACRIA